MSEFPRRLLVEIIAGEVLDKLNKVGLRLDVVVRLDVDELGVEPPNQEIVDLRADLLGQKFKRLVASDQHNCSI